MPDTNKNSFPVIKTPTELAVACSIEAELEQSIAQSQALGVSTNQTEIRLQAVRDAIAQHELGNSSPVTNDASTASEIRLQSPRETTESQPANSISAPNTDATSNPDPSVTPISQIGSDQSTTNSIPASDNSIPAPTDIENSAATQPVSDTQTNSVPDSLLNTVSPGTNSDSSTGTFSAASGNDDPSAAFDEDIVPAVADQTQSFQQSGDRIRAALEQNSLVANSVFTQTLELLDLQNRRFAEMERKMSELSGQMKSLKNP